MSGYEPVLSITNFNITCTVLGASVLIFGLISYIVKERIFLSDSLVALLIGLAFGPYGTNFIRPSAYGDVDVITLAFFRLVIGIQLVLAGVQLPSKYLIHHWKSLFMLLIPIMTLKWVAAATIIKLLFPLTFLEALCVGACVTPTDPVLANSIIKGRFAEQYIAPHLRNLISAESGANDGFGYPFLFLVVYLLKYDHGKATGVWFVNTWLYQIIFSTIYGLIVGLLARYLLKLAERNKWIDTESFLSFFLALALFTIGSCGLLGTDDLLASFIVGNAFSLGNFYRDQTEDDSLQTALDHLLNHATFVWLGATMPWADFNTETASAWHWIVLGISLLMLGRLPFVLALYKFIPEIKSFREALFAGWFGPMGVGAIFYVQVAMEQFHDDPTYHTLEYLLKPIVYFVALSSIIIHGITIPIIQATQLVFEFVANLSSWAEK